MRLFTDDGNLVLAYLYDKSTLHDVEDLKHLLWFLNTNNCPKTVVGDWECKRTVDGGVYIEVIDTDIDMYIDDECILKRLVTSALASRAE